MWKDYPLIDFMAEVIPLVDDECFVVVVTAVVVFIYKYFFKVFYLQLNHKCCDVLCWVIMSEHVLSGWYVGVSGKHKHPDV